MHPVAFHIGSFTIHWYGVLMGLAFLTAMASCIWLGRRDGKETAFLTDFVCWLMVSGIIGARIAHVLGNWQEYSHDPVSILYVHRGGLVYYGGFIGAAVGAAVFARVKRTSIFGMFDIACVALPLSHALGRIGCFINGCCFGTAYAGPTAVRFPLDSPGGWSQFREGLITNPLVMSLMARLRTGDISDSGFAGQLSDLVKSGRISANDALAMPVHPVQLYEAGVELLFYPVLLWIAARRKVKGTVACSYAIAYGLIRFSTEFLRGDARLMAGPLTTAQVTSILLVIAGVVVMTWLKSRERTQVHSAA